MFVMIRRNLTVTYKEEGWKGHNFFHTSCSCKGKVCNVIIDREACENVASSAMVEKLELDAEPHLSPYNLTLIGAK